MRSPRRRLQHLDAHLAQRIEHAAHRPLRQRCVADEGGFHVVGADQAHGEARAGAGIAEIERRLRLQQAAIAGALDDPFVAALLDPRAHRLHGVAGAHHVLAFEQAGDAGLAGGKAAEHEGAVRDRLVARHARRALTAAVIRRAVAGCRRCGMRHDFPFREGTGSDAFAEVLTLGFGGLLSRVLARSSPCQSRLRPGSADLPPPFGFDSAENCD